MSETIYARDYCPECGIGLNNSEIRLQFCQNCKAYWDNDDEFESDKRRRHKWNKHTNCVKCGLSKKDAKGATCSGNANNFFNTN